MLTELGNALRDARARKDLSLHKTAAPARISATYLQKLERGTVLNPSPRVLARLAVTLEVPYLRLMKLAGYLDEEQYAQAQAEARAATPKPHPLANRQLTAEEWREVGAFIERLITRRDTDAEAGNR